MVHRQCYTSLYAYSAPPDPLAGFKGPTSKGGEGREGQGREGEGEWEGKGKEGRRGKGEGTIPPPFLSHFKHCCNQRDDEDIQREIRNMFIRTNLMMRRFSRCSTAVKAVLFKSFCLCLYDVALWSSYYMSSTDKFRSCYNKCMKLFFGYKLHDSVTNMLLETGLPSFDTVLLNCRGIFDRCRCLCNNGLVAVLRELRVCM